MTDTVFGCSLLIVSKEGVLVFFLAVVVVVAGVAVEDDVGFPHWTCTIPPSPPAIQQI